MIIDIGITNDKPERGTRIKELRQDYCIVDIETTGYNPGWDEIIELCAIKVRNGLITDKFVSLVKPNEAIPDFITEMTGITSEMVATAPSLNEILPAFVSFVGNDIILGHNVTFDLNFITFETTQLLGQPFLNNYMDTLLLSRKVLPSASNHRLLTLANEFNLPSPAHRADADCITTKALYDLICKTVEEQNINPFAHAVNKLHAEQITTQNTGFDESNPFYQKMCVFTGALSFTRRNAMQMVADVGGINGDRVTKETDFLIVGSTDYVANLKGAKSSKLKKAEALIANGQDIKILTEETFLQLLDNK